MEAQQVPHETIWTPALETKLFCCLQRQKPVGICRHFTIIEVMNLLNSDDCWDDTPALASLFPGPEVTNNITYEQLWNHLNDIYDLEALDEFENSSLPFDEVTPFELPKTEAIEALMAEKFPRSLPRSSRASSVTSMASSFVDESDERDGSRASSRAKDKTKGKQDKKESPTASTPHSEKHLADEHKRGMRSVGKAEEPKKSRQLEERADETPTKGGQKRTRGTVGGTNTPTPEPKTPAAKRKRH